MRPGVLVALMFSLAAVTAVPTAEAGVWEILCDQFTCDTQGCTSVDVGCRQPGGTGYLCDVYFDFIVYLGCLP